MQTNAASGASARVAPPAVATIFPPRWKRMNTGRACPIIAAAPARTPMSAPPAQSPSAAAAKPFATSSNATEMPSQRPYTRKTLLAPTFPLPSVRMSSPRTRRGTQYPNGSEPRRYPPRTASGSVIGYPAGMRYAETQPFTTDQSRFRRNASMYAARSVW